MALAMGMIALGVVLVAVVVAIVFAGRQADQEAAPKSEPGDFVAPVSSGGYRFRLKAGNGETIASSESYKTKASAFKGIESVRTNAKALVVELPDSD